MTPRPPRSRATGLRLVALMAAIGAPVALGAGSAASSANESTASIRIQQAAPVLTQRLVVLRRDHVARTAPEVHASKLALERDHRPLTHSRTVLPVLTEATSTNGARWLQVRLPGRPNGRAGWIPATGTIRSETRWRIVVQLGRRRVVALNHGRAVRHFRVIVGAKATPTPRGEFFMEEAVALRPGSSGGPFALALSARSSVLQDFDGGPGQIALHGIDELQGQPGTAASHGCVRLADADITWLVHRIGAGVPVTIS